MSSDKLPCSLDGCSSKSYRRGLCGKHYKRALQSGEPAAQPPTLEERFWSKVNKTAPNGCWEWTAALNEGYGKFSVRHGKMIAAHRISYELLVG